MSRLAVAVLSITIFLDFAAAEDLPLYRPALIGTSPDAIINRIDTKLLLKAGQKDAAVMFTAVVDSKGDVKLSWTFRGTPDSKLLEQEVLRVLRDAKMIPAVRNHQPISVFYYGTVTFRIIKEKPRLRIFANQELKELSTENDFIGPQLCFGGDSNFDGVHYPENQVPVPVSGEADLSLKVDANGNLQEEQAQQRGGAQCRRGHRRGDLHAGMAHAGGDQCLRVEGRRVEGNGGIGAHRQAAGRTRRQARRGSRSCATARGYGRSAPTGT